jgi:hypothetical protein
MGRQVNPCPKGEGRQGKNKRKGGRIMNFKKWIILFTASLFILGAGFGAAGAAEKEPINIGVIASLTG